MIKLPKSRPRAQSRAVTSEIKQTKARGGSRVAVLINKLSTVSPEEKHSSCSIKQAITRDLYGIYWIYSSRIVGTFFSCSRSFPGSSCLSLVPLCRGQGLGGSDPAHRVLIAGTSQMCVAFLPPAAPKSPSQVVFMGKKKRMANQQFLAVLPP